MALANEKIASRRLLLGRLREEIWKGLADVAAPIEGGDTGSVAMLSIGSAQTVVNAAFDQPLPPPVETFAEVHTPATIAVSVICPNCDLPAVITVGLHPQLVVSDDGRELAVKAKSKASPHICGQLPLEVGAEGSEQMSLGVLAGIAPETRGLSRDEEPAVPDGPYLVCGVMTEPLPLCGVAIAAADIEPDEPGGEVPADAVCGGPAGHEGDHVPSWGLPRPESVSLVCGQVQGHEVEPAAELDAWHVDRNWFVAFRWPAPAEADAAEGLAGEPAADPDADDGSPDEEPGE